jgi:hypothetical protein
VCCPALIWRSEGVMRTIGLNDTGQFNSTWKKMWPTIFVVEILKMEGKFAQAVEFVVY